MLLDIKNLEREYGERILFHIQSLHVHPSEKIGIVGENGAGKSTLLNIIAGRMEASSGTVKLLAPFSYITQNAEAEAEPSDCEGNYKWGVMQDPHSGGEVSRAKIAMALGKAPELMLCDEPTSNLDESGLVQLEKALIHFKGALLLVSHDRMLMDRVCNKIWKIDGGKITEYTGNYSSFREQENRQRKNTKKEYEKYVRTRKRLEAAAREQSRKASGMKEPPKRMGNSEARLHRMDVRQKAGKVSHTAKNIRSRLEKIEVKEKPKIETNYHIRTKVKDRKRNRVAIRVEDLSFGYGERTVLDGVKLEIKRGEKVCITGDNGSGKSTLLDCIYRRTAGVSVPPSDDIGYFRQNSLNLAPEHTVLECVMRESILNEGDSRTILGALGLRRDAVYKRIEKLSGGEQAKVSLATLLCQGPSILMLDEPTNFLDIYVLEALEEMLKQYDGTLLMVTHDRYFRDRIASRMLSLIEGNIAEVAEEEEQKRKAHQTEIVMLEMKLTQILERMKNKSEREAEVLEREYKETAERLKKFKV